jgi:hypothetical protein
MQRAIVADAPLNASTHVLTQRRKQTSSQGHILERREFVCDKISYTKLGDGGCDNILEVQFSVTLTFWYLTCFSFSFC